MTDNKKKEISDLDAMVADYLKSPDIYHASKFWEKLCQKNIEWLREDGIENFKRTVNNNYFNWMVTTKSSYYRKLLGNFIRKNRSKPWRLFDLLGATIPRLDVRTYVAENVHLGFLSGKVYAFYLMVLYDFVHSMDNLGLLNDLEEPNVGNPITIDLGSKKVSQDICNSYLEYLYLRNSLGSRFEDVNCIAEIGAGYGRLAYVFNKIHHQKIKYIIVDIPPALYIAQWYFDCVCPDVPKFKYRDFKEYSSIAKELEKASICFLLPHQLSLLPNKSIDLLINISSLQEMSPDQIKKYYEIIDEKSSFFYTKQWVFWQNIEDKIAVPAVIYPTNPSWELINARLNPVHTEFFEALFKI